MKSIAFVVLWGGELPEYFPLWLNTCKWNPTIDFLLFTDDRTKFNYPENVKVKYFEFEEIVEMIQKNFEYKITVDQPYKFCDFRPAYGEIFKEYLKEYDFWGHCDLDLFWGNIRKFLTDEVLDSYDKVFSRGHCNLYKNLDEINAWYRNLPTNGAQKAKNVFQTKKSCCFDEWAGHCGGGISQIISSNGIKIFDKIYSADLNTMKGYFKINRREDIISKQVFFEFVNGKLKMVYDNQKEEIMCVHFQKRKLNISKDINKDNFLFIAPNYIINNDNKCKKRMAQKNIEIKSYETKMIYKKLIEKIKRICKKN